MISQPVTEKENALLLRLLDTPYLGHNSDIKEELTFMLNNGYKSSIEGLIRSDFFLSGHYLSRKFLGHNFK